MHSFISHLCLLPTFNFSLNSLQPLNTGFQSDIDSFINFFVSISMNSYLTSCKSLDKTNSQHDQNERQSQIVLNIANFIGQALVCTFISGSILTVFRSGILIAIFAILSRISKLIVPIVVACFVSVVTIVVIICVSTVRVIVGRLLVYTVEILINSFEARLNVVRCVIIIVRTFIFLIVRAQLNGHAYAEIANVLRL